MDYYEELGLRRSATVQEIRHAYKVMARLVHPDGQANEPVRDMAERQMKRLNEILSTLTNEQSRQEYDAGLTAAVGPALGGAGGTNSAAARQAAPNRGTARPGRWWQGAQSLPPRVDSRRVILPAWVRPIVENWFWIALTLVVVCVGVWYEAQNKSEAVSSALLAPVPEGKRTPQDVTQPQRQDARTEAGSGELDKIPQETAPRDYRPPAAERSPAEPARQEPTPPPVQTAPYQAPSRETGLREAARVPPSVPSSAAPATASAAPSTTLGPTAQPAPPSVTSAASKPEAANTAPAGTAKTHTSPLSGNWLYVPDPAEKIQPGAYPATYVELLLAEEHGRLRGTYRAQYQIPDRAVSAIKFVKTR